MPEDLTTATHTQHEDPTADATRSATSYLTLAVAGAQVAVDRAATRTGNRPRTGAGEDLQGAREAFAPMLTRDRGRHTDANVALRAWQAALPFAGRDREAAKAAGRAEDRLRVLHPDALARYDDLRRGLDPVAAMREVVPLLDAEIAHPRADFAPMLGADAGRSATSAQALTAWRSALPLAAYVPGAGVAAARAEDRLRVLHPEAMARYDDLLTRHSPPEAVAQVAPALEATLRARADPPTPPAASAATAAAVATSTGPGTGQGPSAATAGSGTSPVPEGGAGQALTYAAVVREVLPEAVATAVLADRSWPTLAAALDRARSAGADPATVLGEIAAVRELDSATSPAQVLTHRLDHRHLQNLPAPDGSREVLAAQGGPAELGAPVHPDATQETAARARIGASAGSTDAGRAPEQMTAIPAAPVTPAAPAARQPNAADIAALGFATPLTAAPAPARDHGGLDVGALTAGLVLTREATTAADAERQAAGVPDEVSTAKVDEDGVAAAVPPGVRAAPGHQRAAALDQAPSALSVAPAATAAGSPAARLAAVNFAVPLTQAKAPSTSAPAPPARAAQAVRSTQAGTGARHR